MQPGESSLTDAPATDAPATDDPATDDLATDDPARPGARARRDAPAPGGPGAARPAPDRERAWVHAGEALLTSALAGATPPTEDIRAAVENALPLLAAAESTEAWDWSLEPALAFDPLLPFAATRPVPWPTAPADDGAQPPAGPLRTDIEAALHCAPAEIAARYRARIASAPDLGAFLTVCPPDHPQGRPHPDALPRGPLWGACLAVKDIIETAGWLTTGGSAQRANHTPSQDAVCWARLRSAGALCLGKTNTHEFAAGSTSENEHFGPVRNPRDLSRVAGGSSGGSAAAVAAGLAAAALGTDTGGSVRIPAACCGVVGFKPTYGRVPRQGVFPLSWTLDHVGPIAATVPDAALLFGALADPPSAQGRASLAAPPGPALRVSWRGLRIGVPYAWLEEAGDSAPVTGGLATAASVRDSFGRALECARALGATVVPVDLGSADAATAVNRLIALPESAAWHAPHLWISPERYGRRVRTRLLAGRLVGAEAYLQAQRLRALLCRRYAAALRPPHGVQLIATPTLPTIAPPLGAPPAHGLALLRFCAPFNVVGWPAITLPCGRSPEGLPIGLQLASAPWADEALLAVAAELEAALANPGR